MSVYLHDPEFMPCSLCVNALTDNYLLHTVAPPEPSPMTTTDPVTASIDNIYAASNTTSTATDRASNNSITGSTTATSDNNAPIIGGVVTVILMLTIIIAVVAITIALVKKQRGNMVIYKQKA